MLKGYDPVSRNITMLVEEKNLVARGKQRSVYQFNNDKPLLLKLAEEGTGLEAQTGLRGFLKHYFPYARYRHIFNEIEQETKIQMRAKLKGVRCPIAPTRGVFSSNTTFGLLVEQISQKDGSIGLTLRQLYEQDKLDDKALNALNEFAQSIFALGIVAGDVHANNVVWGDIQGELVPFLVDGYGDRNFIPLKTYIPWFRKRKINKCFTHMAKGIGCEWSRSEQVFKRQSA